MDPLCVTEGDIRSTLERSIGMVESYHDLTHVNVFPRTLPTLFYVHEGSYSTLVSRKEMVVLPLNVSQMDSQPLLVGPYPFYLFWSPTKVQNPFQRLGDEPSDELIDALLAGEQEQDRKSTRRFLDIGAPLMCV